MKLEVQERPWEVRTERVWGLALNEHFEALFQGGLIHPDSLYGSIRAGPRR